jgi:endonuclease YncB( thermonuclease family)
MTPDLRRGRKYEVEITDVADGDTVTFRFNDGSTAEWRALGIDTPELSAEFERPEEWVGIDDPQTLLEWGERAKTFAQRMLGGKTATLTIDESADVRDDFGRVLGYLSVDGTDYNRAAIATGHARVYDSDFTRHDDYATAAETARANGRGIWAESTPEDSTVVRNFGDEGFDRLFFPLASPVGTVRGRPADDRVPVFAAPSATLPSGDRPGNVPLAVVDPEANVVVLGSPVVAERFEQTEGYSRSIAEYGNFPFLTNLLTRVGSGNGDVLIDGGHGQFGVEYGLSAEDTAYYGRYLEGVGLRLTQRNDLGAARLSDYRAVLITTGPESFTAAEIAALRNYTDRGGTVVLLGGSTVPRTPRENLNGLAAALGSDLRVRAETVRDGDHALPPLTDDGEPQTPPENLITTSIFNGSFDVFGPFPEGE